MIEAISLDRLFQDNSAHISVTANKSMTVHMFGATGEFEAIALVKTLARYEVTPIRNYRPSHHEEQLNLNTELLKNR
ncbi:hypothetical protein [Brochothrix thermosphacta]|uniref:hypothetical protein n=1 Tax=Brochothrix thermosphacta TaxID=2756 RepID=UPI00083FBAAF|nr:hypothetical protein [Brochothrix thermosphacta]ODJ71156.1 hypothetical protein BFR43_04670 [Brochothrix thermosphacta]